MTSTRPTPDPGPLARRIQALLAETEPTLTQAELARRTGLSKQTVNEILRGRQRRPQLHTLDLIAAVLAGALGRPVTVDALRRDVTVTATHSPEAEGVASAAA